MIRLLPVLFVLSASAANATVELKPSRTFMMGTADQDVKVLATATESSINVFDIATGRQLALVDIPSYRRKRTDDEVQINVYSIRSDHKVMLVDASYWQKNPNYVAGKINPWWARAESRIFLASFEQGRSPIKLWSGEGPCVSAGRDICPGIVQPNRSTMLRNDRPEVMVNVVVAASQKGSDLRQTTKLLVFDFKGKKISDNEMGHVWRNGWETIKGEWKEPGWNAAGDIRITQQSCLMIRAGKTVSFLERCTGDDDSPYLSRDGKSAWAISEGTYKAWDTETGKLKISFAPKFPTGWSAGSYWTEIPGGRIAGMVNGPDGAEELQVWDSRSGRLIASGSGPGFKGGHSLKAGDGHLLFNRHDKDYKGDTVSRTVVVDLDFGDTPSAPTVAAAPKLDVDAPPEVSSRLDPDAFAIVIGVEKYRQAGVPAVDYASRDAKTMAAYLGAMGFDHKNVAVLTDAQAGKVDFDKHFGSWLKNRVGPKSRVFVYYAGHGAPNPTTGAGYLMPYEADPSYLEETAYPVARLYAELAKLPAKDVTVVLDACFSGQGERSLIAKGTRPLVAVQKTRAPENAAVIAAASGSQISASDHEARHGLLTYHLLAGLHGGADQDNDGKITTSELFSYAQPAVERAAKLQNVEQTPTVSGATGAAGARVWTTLKKP